MRKTKEQNSKHQIPNTNKGITLIALVITIIVMLILVAVTISMAVNGGLFDFAGRAATETENAIEKEQLLAEGKIEIDGTWYNSIDEYVNSTLEVHSWTRSGDTFICAHCNTTYTMGDVINYTPNGKESTTITAQKSGLDVYYTNKGSYPTTNVDENGAQTIEVQDTTWVVLGMEDTNRNGTYETLLITTQESVGVNSEGLNLYFYGAAAYNNGPEEINRICKELYSNSSYGEARGMTIDDVNSVLNYKPQGGYYYTSSTGEITTGNLTTKLKDLEIFEGIVASGTNTPDGKNTEEALGEYELTDYGYIKNGLNLINSYDSTEITTITEVEGEIIFGTSTDYDYWLATNGVYASDYGYYASFGLGHVSRDWVSSHRYMFTTRGNGNEYHRNFRPVVSLISTLPTV